MADNGEALAKIISQANGPAGDLVRDLAEGFGAIAVEKWPEATNHLANVTWDHARIGGSLAQRDLIEFAMLATLLKQGRQSEARLLIATRRPVSSTANAVKGH
jgi:hypothetical protein